MHSAACAVVQCLSVCPSVRVSLSNTLVYYVATTELIIKQLAQDCSVGILVYGHQKWNMYGVFRVSPHKGVNMRGCLKAHMYAVVAHKT